MRSIEVVRLTDAQASERGLYVARTMRSKDNIVSRTPRLEDAWDEGLAARAQRLARPMNRHMPIPIRAEQRFLFVSELGTPLTKPGLNTAWQCLVRIAIKAKVIAPE